MPTFAATLQFVHENEDRIAVAFLRTPRAPWWPASSSFRNMQEHIQTVVGMGRCITLLLCCAPRGRHHCCCSSCCHMCSLGFGSSGRRVDTAASRRSCRIVRHKCQRWRNSAPSWRDPRNAAEETKPKQDQQQQLEQLAPSSDPRQRLPQVGDCQVLARRNETTQASARSCNSCAEA